MPFGDCHLEQGTDNRIVSKNMKKKVAFALLTISIACGTIVVYIIKLLLHSGLTDFLA